MCIYIYIYIYTWNCGNNVHCIHKSRHHHMTSCKKKTYALICRHLKIVFLFSPTPLAAFALIGFFSGLSMDPKVLSKSFLTLSCFFCVLSATIPCALWRWPAAFAVCQYGDAPPAFVTLMGLLQKRPSLLGCVHTCVASLESCIPSQTALRLSMRLITFHTWDVVVLPPWPEVFLGSVVTGVPHRIFGQSCTADTCLFAAAWTVSIVLLVVPIRMRVIIFSIGCMWSALSLRVLMRAFSRQGGSRLVVGRWSRANRSFIGSSSQKIMAGQWLFFCKKRTSVRYLVGKTNLYGVPLEWMKRQLLESSCANFTKMQRHTWGPLWELTEMEGVRQDAACRLLHVVYLAALSPKDPWSNSSLRNSVGLQNFGHSQKSSLKGKVWVFHQSLEQSLVILGIWAVCSFGQAHFVHYLVKALQSLDQNPIAAGNGRHNSRHAGRSRAARKEKSRSCNFVQVRIINDQHHHWSTRGASFTDDCVVPAPQRASHARNLQ